jgi:hypothetical protein
MNSYTLYSELIGLWLGPHIFRIKSKEGKMIVAQLVKNSSSSTQSECHYLPLMLSELSKFSHESSDGALKQVKVTFTPNSKTSGCWNCLEMFIAVSACPSTIEQGL